MHFALLLTTCLVILLAAALLANAFTCTVGPRALRVSVSGMWVSICFSLAASVAAVGLSIAAAVSVEGAAWLLLVPSAGLAFGSLIMVAVACIATDFPQKFH